MENERDAQAAINRHVQHVMLAGAGYAIGPLALIGIAILALLFV